MIELRAYQVDVVAQVDQAIAAGKRRIIIVAPTGSGKTVIGAEFIKQSVSGYKKSCSLPIAMNC